MKIAIWDTPMGEAAAGGLAAPNGEAGRGTGVQVVRLRPEACAAAVLKQQVDVALVPTVMALQGAGGFDVIPDVAISSWKNPFARIVLKTGLRGDDLRLACDRRAVQEQFMARVVLREHYQLDLDQVLYDAPSPIELLRSEEDAALLTTADLDALPDLGRLGGGGLVMDLGQEWFELTKYPMVWGLFVAREDTLDADATAALRDRLHTSEEYRPRWVREAQHPLVEEFFRDDLRLRHDDLTVAGLTELERHLFYDGVLGDIPDLSFAPLPDEEEE
jgi:predicted solute-binding protein